MTTTRFGLVLDPVFQEHRNPAGHPERPERISCLLDLFEDPDSRIRRIAPVGLEEEVLLRVHEPALVRRIRRTSGESPVMIDPDTHAGERSYETACLAAGSGVRLVELLGAGEIETGFLLARPPGHHAESDRAMGFCLFNNVAVAAQRAIDVEVADKVAVVDFDVHHGNGIQEIFWNRRDVLYVSSHQFPLYPGTGRLSEVGTGAGEGFTVNFPLPAGSDDSLYVSVYRELVIPILREFGPDLILVSAGFDAHTRDPLASMEMSNDGFAALSGMLKGVAEEVCGGRLLFFLEGGYDLEALHGSVQSCVGVLLDGPLSQPTWGGSHSAEQYLRQAKGRLAPYWKCLAGKA